ncbi:MAG: 4'-phosphopantetheinyl transferase superfamily protein [Ktedonobacteraceae bacterium]|nr:4'-phosphopantetheinyl transferase superfamily protein [Ktedonobacteraceae bacterium]
MILTWVRPQTPLQQLVCLGLDICGAKRWEQMLLRTPEIATRVFTDSERQWAEARPERLARLWTVKEALAKALGCGFAGLAYQGIAIEFAARCPTTWLPATFPTDMPGELGISGLSWQLILFREQTLLGALVFAWKQASDPVLVTPLCHATKTSQIVLELRSTSGAQTATRREKHAAERLAARQAAYSAASRFLPAHTHQQLDIRQAHSGRPLLQVTEHDLVTTSSLCLSLSHCSGWAAAALGGFSYTEDSASSANRVIVPCCRYI